VEDVKKYLYAGSKMVILDSNRESNILMIKEAADRFGSDKLSLRLRTADMDVIQTATDHHLAFLMVNLENEAVLASAMVSGLSVLADCDHDDTDFLMRDHAYGITGPVFSKADTDIAALKETYKSMGIKVNSFESSIPFSKFKLDANGLIPVVVQDYKTDEVLMVAYMNEEAYQLTLRTGRMTYYSRSRQEIWVKGLTSGHFQYAISLDIDCDNDTLLAHVKQIGAACHTGNRSCFYRNLAAKEDVGQTNPLKVFTDVMNVILDRKEHPKEGSYTNYLFDKGIDKILKKCGEEATEIVIAAKNPDPEEIKYEISDFLYHVMVLMAVKGVTWEDIIKELANR
jgi:phosphoribosyl-ATP pyrophosphohydrolase/phosphoribosyl-AMP cyclohydrolase